KIQPHNRPAPLTGRHQQPEAITLRLPAEGLQLKLSLTALDLLAWTRILLLEGELAPAEPKKLRYRLLHAAARITRAGRRIHLRIAATWPWRNQLTSAFARLAALPRPAT
ncbi:transposase, partial [Streptomyces chiangmaiensis]